MIDLKKVRENPEAYQTILQRRGNTLDLDAVLDLDDQRKTLQLQIDQSKAQQKQLAAQQDYE